MTEFDVRAFDEYEAAGWELVASRYEHFWSPITSQAIDALLDAARARAGIRVLDVGTGTGEAAARRRSEARTRPGWTSRLPWSRSRRGATRRRCSSRHR